MFLGTIFAYKQFFPILFPGRVSEHLYVFGNYTKVLFPKKEEEKNRGAFGMTLKIFL